MSNYDGGDGLKKIYKSYTDKKLAGVCGGIAQVFGIDSTIVRGIWALCGVFIPVSILVYIILAFLLPYSDAEIVGNTKKIYKSTTDKKISGVCGGIAEYLEIDSSLVRVCFVALVLFLGTGIIEYLVLSWVMPTKNEQYFY